MDETYKGPERRSAEHCGLHMDNTTKITTLATSYSTLKWVIGIGVPVIVVMLGAFYSDIKDIKTLLVNNQISTAVITSKIDSFDTRIKDVEKKVEQLHPYGVSK